MSFLVSIARAEETAQPVAATTPSWFQTAFKKLGEFPAWGWILMAILVLLGSVLLVSIRKKHGQRVWTTQMIAIGAVSMALSSILSMIRLYRMPMGGSVTPASMLPLLLFAYIYGAGPGITLGALYGVLQFILDGGEFAFTGLIPNLLDYPIGFAMLGLCGLARTKSKGLVIGVILGCIGRFLCSFLSGWIFYGAYAPEGMSPIVYAAAYNGTFMGVECIICVLLAIIVGERLVQVLKRAR